MTWHTVKTDAIVLTSQPIREADRLYRAITPEYGKISFVGRGARKAKAKLASHLEPFAVIDIEIVRGRKSVTVISVERREAFTHIFQTPEHRFFAQSILQLVDKHTYSEDPDPDLYKDVYEWLHFLDTTPGLSLWRQRLLFGVFSLRFMERLGYRVELRDCVQCKEPILPLSFRWHTGKGGLVCTDCVKSSPGDWLEATSIDEEVVTLLRLARESDVETLNACRLPVHRIQSMLDVAHAFMQYHLPFAPDQPVWQSLFSLDSPTKDM